MKFSIKLNKFSDKMPKFNRPSSYGIASKYVYVWDGSSLVEGLIIKTDDDFKFLTNGDTLDNLSMNWLWAYSDTTKISDKIMK